MKLAPHLTVEALHQRYRAAEDPVARSQWQMLWLLAGGMPTAQVAQMTGYTVRWVQEVARRYRAGPDAIGDRRHGNPGIAPLLDTPQQAQLRAALGGPAPDGGLWTCRHVAHWIGAAIGRPVDPAVGLHPATAPPARDARRSGGPGGVQKRGLAAFLKEALAAYTQRGREETGIPQADAVAVMLEKFEIVSAMMHGFDPTPYFSGTAAQKLQTVLFAMDHILGQEDGKRRYMQAVTELSKAFALAVPSEAALAIRDAVGFFQAVRASFAKTTVTEAKQQEDLESAVRQLVSRAVIADGVVDLFRAAGMKTPDISILSDEFLAEIRELPQRNLAMEALRKLLDDEIKIRSRRNVVEAQSFAEMLDRSIRRYQNRAIDAAEVIAELIALAKEMRAARERGEKLGLSEDEIAFYDALGANDSAVHVLGDETLRLIARELVRLVRANVSIDWAVRESARARLRILVKRVLREYGYPPDQQDVATRTVLRQAELFSGTWAA